MRWIVIAALAAFSAGGGAMAADEGRYALVPTENGYLKLDTAKGTISECTRREAGLTCVMVPDDRDALQAEIDRLAARVRELEAGTAQTDGSALSLPSDEDLDRIFGLMERSMRRFRQMIEPERNEAQPQTL